MKFSISRNDGQYQFWHMDCEGRRHESPMHSPKNLADNVKEFECVACGKKGQVTMPVIMVGNGMLDEV